MSDKITSNTQNIDIEQSNEWVEALDSLLDFEGAKTAQLILDRLNSYAQTRGLKAGAGLNTAYANTLSVACSEPLPVDENTLTSLSGYMRWNAIAMVMRAGERSPGVGGHIGTYASTCCLFETGFNFFFQGKNSEHSGDFIFFQGHASPGIYARAFLEGRLSTTQLDNFRREAFSDGLSSYPHPWLMPDFWQFPTVSMGLGAMQAIYQAQFIKYLQHRKLIASSHQKAWAFCGDGEMDEPESLGALRIAGREKLDNLIFVVSCNLQRLDGPVNGNGQIIQELESVYLGAGWRVIKVILGSNWDMLIEKDTQGLIMQRFSELVDGDFQKCASQGGAYIRSNIFGTSPELLALVENMSDESLEELSAGGQDFKKLFAAYFEAVHHKDQPTVILAKTVKGLHTGGSGQGLNTTHQSKKVALEDRLALRDHFSLPLSDEQVKSLEYIKPAEGSAEAQLLKEQREALGGVVPVRNANCEGLHVPELNQFSTLLEGSGEREVSTTMQFVRFISVLLKDKHVKDRVVPIVPDECRTFGMEGLFRQIGIYAPFGQQYEPEDVKLLMRYHEAQDGQLLQHGISELGAMSSWIAAATSYANTHVMMVPFYIYYSMFGMQRVGDAIWSAADMRARGFLLGATAGRTTLEGEGLQHQDGHNLMMFGMVPTCKSYDPTFAYELAVILQDGMQKMYVEQQDIFYYVTLMNENYQHPAMPEGVEQDIIKGLYCFRQSELTDASLHVQLLGSGTILREVIEAAEILESSYGIAATIWSATSFNELYRDMREIARYNRLHPQGPGKQSHVASCFADCTGPFIAATDYIKGYAEQISADVPGSYHVLGTDGFGRSDSRKELRDFFEVNCNMIVYTALKALFDQGKVMQTQLDEAVIALSIDVDRENPELL